MVGVKRLPTHPHDRAIALVRDSLPMRDYREFPESAAKVMRASARERAVCYAALEEVSDTAVRVVEEIEDADGVVLDLSDDADAVSVVRHLIEVEHAVAAMVDEDDHEDDS